MCKDFYERFDIVKDLFNRAKNASIYNKDYAELCFEADDTELQKTVNTQPALYIANSVIFAVLKTAGLKPLAAAGHSLGEYCALFAAEVFDFETGLQLIEKRALYMDDCAKNSAGTMAAIMGIDETRLLDLCKQVGGIINFAGYNSPGQIVISGEVAAIKNLINKIKSENLGKAIELKVSGAWHSELMRAAQQKLAIELEKIDFRTPKFPIISNLSAQSESIPAKLKDLLIRQLCEPVRWTQSINTANELFNPKAYIESGPGKVLTGLIKRIVPEVQLFNINSVESYEQFLL